MLRKKCLKEERGREAKAVKLRGDGRNTRQPDKREVTEKSKEETRMRS